jgi:hypothetical protein
MNVRLPDPIGHLEAAAGDLHAIYQTIALGIALEKDTARPLISALREIGSVKPREALTLELGTAEGGLLLRPAERPVPVYERAGRRLTLDQVQAIKPRLMDALTVASEAAWPAAS